MKNIHIHLRRHHHQHESAGEKRRMLIKIRVMGSAGPIRVIADETQPVDSVISSALKTYAREGRLPVLGSNDKNFQLYCPAFDDDVSPSERIGSLGCRHFTLHKKKNPEEETLLLEKKIWGDGVDKNTGQHPKAWFKKQMDPDAPRSGHGKIQHHLAEPIIPILIPVFKKPQVEEKTRKDSGGEGKHSMKKNSVKLKAWFHNSIRIAPYPFLHP